MPRLTVTGHGNGKHQVSIPVGHLAEFSRQHRRIRVVVEGQVCYSELPSSFFEDCPHLRTAYENPELTGPNILEVWLAQLGAETALVEFVGQPANQIVDLRP
jgi:hypothetical protein